MYTKRYICCLAVLLGLLASPVRGDVTLTLKGNKKRITGQVLRLEGDKVFVKSGNVRMGIAVSQLTTASLGVVADELSGKLDPKEANAFLDLGDFCLRHKLWERARKAYRQARKIDDSYVTRSLSKKGIEQADQQEARALYQAGVDHQGAGRQPEAARAFRALVTRFPASRFAAPARKLLDVLEQTTTKKAGPKQAKQPGRVAKRQPKGGAKPPPKKKPAKKKLPKNPYLRYMQKLLAEIEAHRKAALKEEGEGHHHKAIKQYEAGLGKMKTVEQIATKLSAAKPEVAEAAQELAAGLPKLKTRFYLALGHIHASVDQLRQATRYVNEILIEQPENKEALALRDKITEERMRRVINLNKQGQGNQ